MVISLFFSANLYRVSVQEINRSFIRQTQILQKTPRFQQFINDPEFIQQRVDQLREAKAKIIYQLLMTNIVILAAGGLLSYWFARRTLKPIQDSHEAQSRFTADASHELRTPITAMTTEIEVALRDPNISLKESKELLSSNLEELGKLNNLVESLLRLARLEEEAIEFQANNLDDIFSSAIDRVDPLAKHKGVILDIEKIQIQAQCDRDTITEVLIILLDNAIKYTPKGKSIKMSAVEYEKTIAISVVDQGPGVDITDQDKIFDRFYRADTSRNKDTVGGYGLGLSIASQIAHLHGGSLGVENEPDSGAKFTLSLPRV